MAYIGVSPSNGVRRKHTYTATAAQTSFSGAGAEGITLGYLDSNYVDVYQNGVKLSEADYTSTSGTAIVLATGATVSDMIEVVVYDVFSVADTVSKSAGGTFDADVTFADGADITTASAGTSNFRAGVNAGNNIQSGGNYNTVVGDESGTNITTGDSNVAVGFESAKSLNTGSNTVAIGYQAGEQIAGGNNNIAIGKEALSTEVSGSLNVAIGSNALKVQNVGSDAYNVAIGYNVGLSVTSGVSNTFIGGLAGDALDTGGFNVAVGRSTLTTDVKGSKSTAIGFGTLRAQTFSGATDTMNTAVGFEAGNDITSGVNNTLIGGLAGDAIGDADNNTAVGFEALSTNVNGSASVAIGYGALKTQNYASATDGLNVAVGNNAGVLVTTGERNILVGGLSGQKITDADDTVAIGYRAGGGNAGAATTGHDNVCVGTDCGAVLTSGQSNTFIGRNSGSQITTGDSNSILGRYQGNSGGLDIRTLSNRIILSDGDGTIRLYIDNAGNALFGTVTNGTTAVGTVIRADGEVLMTRNNAAPLLVNRAGNDGTLVEFRQANSEEGGIVVNGSTVSYNGGHLSRWSRLLNNSKDTSIVKGTVMTNLDEMIEWKHEKELWTKDDELPDGVSIGDVKKDAYTEDNEQLNKMAVSSVEGDANVAGVFVNWDDDDDWNDMNMAMTGDMVIRIAQGVTVARGDLLMSAGDGTAKTQGDDIVRSKTIAKVTSTNVSHTYDDGTYLVPCVLMAC